GGDDGGTDRADGEEHEPERRHDPHDTPGHAERSTDSKQSLFDEVRREQTVKASWMIASLAAMSVAGVASADPADDAAKVFEQAGIAAGRKDWSECVAKAEAAWAIFQHGQIRGLQGKCEVELGKYREGATHIAFYAKNSTSGVEQDFLDALKKAKEHVAELTVQGAETSADITIDSQPMGRGPITLFLDPGKHHFEATSGAKKGAVDFDAVAGTKPPEPVVIPFPTTPPPGQHRPIWPAILGLSVTAGLLGAGIGTAVAANADPDFHCPSYPCEAGTDFETNKRTLSNASPWLFISAGVVAIPSTVLLIWALGKPQSEPAPVAVVPIVSTDAFGVELSTHF
ncbi:MAG: hypothetical protein U0414_27520, partial [Polyangiaceae bacterium]